jgi:parallel beta-helix repeat protein
VQGLAANCVTGPPASCTPAGLEITGVTIQGNVIQDNDKALVTSGPTPTCAGEPTFEQEDCGEGLHLDGVAFSTVTGNQINGNAGGILLTDETNANHDNLVSQNTVENNVPDCGITLPSHPPNGDFHNIGMQSFGVFDDTVANNLSEGNGAAGTGVFAPTPGTASFKHLIIGNRLIDNTNPGVIFHSHAPGQKLNDTSIVGNFISGNGAEPNPGPSETDGPMDTTGIEVYADAIASPITGVKIVGNTIKNEGNDIWVGAPSWSNCGTASSPCYVVDAHMNNFAPHSVGVNNQGSASAGGDVQVQATNNFWGCGKGPGNGPCASTMGNVIDFPFLSKPQ